MGGIGSGGVGRAIGFMYRQAIFADIWKYNQLVLLLQNVLLCVNAISIIHI